MRRAAEVASLSLCAACPFLSLPLSRLVLLLDLQSRYDHSLGGRPMARALLGVCVAVMIGLSASPGSETLAGQPGTDVPKEFTVSPGQSIQGVLDQAPCGALINLAAGTYIESLHIDKSVTIRGIQGDPALVLLVPGGEEEGLTARPDPEGAPTQIELAWVTLANRGQHGGGVLARGITSVFFSHCTFASVPIAASAQEGARVTIADSEIRDTTGWTALHADGPSELAVRTTSILRSAGCGVVAGGSAQVTIERSAIAFWAHSGDKTRSGLSARGSSSWTIRECAVSDSPGNGFDASEFSTAVVVASQFSRCRHVSIAVGGQSAVEVSATTVADNWGWTGIWVGDSATSEVTDCTVTGGSKNGITIGDSAHATIADTAISANGQHGVMLALDGSGLVVLEWNDITNNGGFGIRLVEGSRGQITGGGNTLRWNREGDVNALDLESLLSG